MFFPQFDNILDPATDSAPFDDLKIFHSSESQSLVKFGYGLTLKALNPTNLENQNVKLVLQAFSEYVTATLSELGEKRNLPTYKGTKGYIEIILRMETGKLSRETHLALTHTTHAILELAKYCMTELNFSYFLPGKIQTDPLEERFGKYRMLAGSQYNISVRQVFECEAKLRLQDSLPLVVNSSKYGLIEIKPFDISDACEEKSTVKLSEIIHSITVGEKDLRDLEPEILVLTYLVGYCVYKLSKKLKCVANWIVDVVSIGMCAYAVMLKLISKPHEQEFLNTGNHKQVLVMITTAQLKEELSHLDVCDAGHTLETTIQHIVSMFSNALLRNYCLKKNDTCKKNPK
ncbi:hypothetical protein PR048_012516 [Dryococelus australis]|uniref:Uncharacterized protein n=1 Tax=Dryococelus australis TaxID=614101 RepID=A0ABQ9HPM0_9NEOP|nr:hypothetical protein PR048_012516 [Dryococelus australis]